MFSFSIANMMVLFAAFFASLAQGNQLSLDSNCTDLNFLCANGKCISRNLTCDNFDHCGDGSDETITCPKGCESNGTLVLSGTTVQDTNWWYLCNRSRWRIGGCMVGGRRYSVGETFFGHMGEFWGKCDFLGSSYIRRHLQGCVDFKGNPVKPGTAYLSDPLFWSLCSGTRQQFNIPGEGTIAINTVRRQIIGCFDGSPTPVPDDEQFIQINDPVRGLGVAYQCRTSGEIEWPEVVPIACVFKNDSSQARQLDFIGLEDKCFIDNGSAVYSCSIFAEKLSGNFSENDNETWQYSWELIWNKADAEMMSDLRKRGYKSCGLGKLEKVQTGEVRPSFRMAVSGEVADHGLRRRRKRNNSMQNVQNSFLDQDVFSVVSS